MTENKKFSGKRMVAGCIIHIFFNMGALGCLAIFMPSICAENGFTTAQLSFMFTLAGLGSLAAATFITPYLLKKIGPKNCMLIASIVVAGHLFGYGQATSLIPLYIFAFCGGLSIGIGIFAACSALIANWYYKNRITMIGYMSSASGLGSAAFKSLSGYGIGWFGYRNTYTIIAIAIIVATVIVQLMVRNKPSDLGQEQYGLAEYEAAQASKSEKSIELPGVTLKEAVKSPALWMVIVAIMAGQICSMGFNQYFATLLNVDYGMEITTVSNFSAIYQLFCMVAIAFSGKIVDKFGIKVYAIYAGVCTTAAFLIIVLTGSTFASMPALIIATTLILSPINANQSANNQIITNSIFGAKDFTSIQAYLVAAGSAGSALTSIVCVPLMTNGSVVPCFRLFVGLAFVWMVLVLLASTLSPMKKKEKVR